MLNEAGKFILFIILYIMIFFITGKIADYIYDNCNEEYTLVGIVIDIGRCISFVALVVWALK